MKKDKFFTWTPSVIFLVLICSLLWGSAFPALKLGFSLLDIEENTGGKLYFAAYRFFLSGLLIFLGIKLSGGTLRLPDKRDYLVVGLLGIVQITVLYTLFYIGLSNTTGMKSAIINGSSSFYMALFSHWWIKGDSLNLTKTVGLVFGFSGIVLISLSKGSLDLDLKLTGEGFMMLTAICGALGALIVKKGSIRIAPPLMSGYQLFIGSIFLFLIAACFESPDILQFSQKSTLLVLYLSFLSAAAFTLWYILIKYNSLTKIAVYRFLVPISGTLLSGLLIANESLSWQILLSLTLVSTGIFLSSRKPSVMLLK